MKETGLYILAQERVAVLLQNWDFPQVAPQKHPWRLLCGALFSKSRWSGTATYQLGERHNSRLGRANEESIQILPLPDLDTNPCRQAKPIVNPPRDLLVPANVEPSRDQNSTDDRKAKSDGENAITCCYAHLGEPLKYSWNETRRRQSVIYIS